MSIRISTDLSRLRNFLSKEPEREKQVLGFFQEEGSEIVTGLMQSVTPIKTGRLFSSYETTRTDTGFFVRPTAWYAIIVERKQHFIRGVIEDAINAIRDLVEDIYGRVYNA